MRTNVCLTLPNDLRREGRRIAKASRGDDEFVARFDVGLRANGLQR